MATPAPPEVRTFYALAHTGTIKDVAQAFETLTGTDELSSLPSSYLFALLVELRAIHVTDGACGDGQRARELLQDFIAHTSAEGDQKCRK